MSTVKVLAGDLDKGNWSFGFNTISKASTAAHPFKGETISLRLQLETVQSVDEENVKKLAGTAAWATLGAVALGPIGAVGGLLLGGNKKEVAFVAKLKDGRKFMATTDGKTWKKLMAICF